MIARILLNDGPAVLTAQKGIYHMDREEVAVPGPVQFQTADGYRLTTRDVDIDMKARTMKSHGRVDGRMPVGTFSGDQLKADLVARTVKLQVRERLGIDQTGINGRALFRHEIGRAPWRERVWTTVDMRLLAR